MAKITQEQEHIWITHKEFDETITVHKSAYKRYKREGWVLCDSPSEQAAASLPKKSVKKVETKATTSAE